MEGAAVRVTGFSWRYAGAAQLALDGVDFAASAGECVVVTGRSGCGKSTLTYALNGLIPHMHEGEFAGTVEVAGVDVLHSGSYDVARHVGSVFQDPRSQFFATTTTDEVAFGCENLGLPREEIERRVNWAFSAMGADGLRDREIFGLSSGEKQKIAVAGVLAMQPQVVVMDEPSANLDNGACAMLAGLVCTLKGQGRTVVIAEHRTSYLMDVADRFVLMDEGHVAAEWSKAEFAGLSRDEVVGLGLRAPDIAAVPLLPGGGRSRAGGAAAAALEADDVRAAYGRRAVLRGVSFACESGAVIAVVGSNGAGKTTLARVVAGLKKADAGAISMDGRPMACKDRREACDFVMQDADYQLFCESVEAEMRFSRAPTRETEARIDAVLASLGLDRCRHAHPMTLSGGQKQRLTIGCVLVGDARTVLFDEPTSGLDGGNMREIARLVRALAAEGRRILIVTHDYEFVATACDRVLHVEDGRIADDFAVREPNRERLLHCLSLAGG